MRNFGKNTAYSVEVSPSALADAELAYFWMQEHFPDGADDWFNGLQEAVLSLAEMPGRCPLAVESEDIGRPLRQLLYGNRRQAYRIVFSVINDDLVRVHTIRHSALERLRAEDFGIES